MKSHFIYIIAVLLMSMSCSKRQEPAEVSHPGAKAVQEVENIPYSFVREPFINPRIVEALTTWVSDYGMLIPGINLADANDSDRFFVHKIKVGSGSTPWVGYETDPDKHGYTEGFYYQYIGRTSSGVHVVRTQLYNDGRSNFGELLLCWFERGTSLKETYQEATNEHRTVTYRPVTNMTLLRAVGSNLLGYRFAGEIKVEGNNIHVRPDPEWPDFDGDETHVLDITPHDMGADDYMDVPDFLARKIGGPMDLNALEAYIGQRNREDLRGVLGDPEGQGELWDSYTSKGIDVYSGFGDEKIEGLHIYKNSPEQETVMTNLAGLNLGDSVEKAIDVYGRPLGIGTMPASDGGRLMFWEKDGMMVTILHNPGEDGVSGPIRSISKAFRGSTINHVPAIAAAIAQLKAGRLPAFSEDETFADVPLPDPVFKRPYLLTDSKPMMGRDGTLYKLLFFQKDQQDFKWFIFWVRNRGDGQPVIHKVLPEEFFSEDERDT